MQAAGKQDMMLFATLQKNFVQTFNLICPNLFVNISTENLYKPLQYNLGIKNPIAVRKARFKVGREKTHKSCHTLLLNVSTQLCTK